MPPILPDFEAMIDRMAHDTLGHSISYQIAGQAPRSIKAQVDYNDQAETWGGIQSRNQDIEICVLKSDVPNPGPNDRITGMKVSGTFRPKGAVANASEGRAWYINVERVR